ncbi:MAG: FG-GAP-like repeat-containing protein [bacterium]
MKFVPLLMVFLLISTYSLLGQNKLYSEDNGKVMGAYTQKVNFEESCLLKPSIPCLVDTVYVYLKGGAPCRDTIWLAMDPSDGLYPPTAWVLHYAAYAELIFQYTGEGWYKFDVTDKEINIGGFNRISVMHHINTNGPALAYDNVQQGTTYATIQSWMCDVYTPNPDFLNIAGTITSPAGGHFLARLSVRYLYPEGAAKPTPTMVDATIKAKLTDNSNNPLLDAVASTVDWNRDGWDDLAFAGYFFQNNKDGSYKNVTSTIGIPGGQTVWGDIDNDGYVDCFVLGGGLNDKIYWGNSDGTFTENTDKVMQIDQPTVTPILFDYNKDGLLDIYIAYGRKEVNGSETYFQDQLYKNIGNRKFENVTVSSGISKGEVAPFYDCWGASVCDYNNDGWPDIFVATYRLAPDLLYKNNGDGTFTEVGKLTGARGMDTPVPYYFGHGMGSDWGDYDNDGDYDLAVGNLGHPDQRGLSSNPSLILENNNSQTFTNVTNKRRLLFFEMNAGIVWSDLNNDSWLDLVHAEYSYNSISTTTPNHSRFYLNSGKDGDFKLVDKTWEWGANIHGAWCPIRLDYDNDGDMDILVASSNESVKLFKNDLPDKGNWIEIRLIGDKGSGMNSLGYGASVILESNNNKYIRNLPGSILNGHAAQSSNILHFGLGESAKADKITINWNNPAKDVTVIENPPVNMILEIGKTGLLNQDNSALLALDKSILDFGTVNCNQSKEMTIKITNIGISGAAISDIKIDIADGFKLKNAFTSKTILKGEYIDISVVFNPLEKKNYNAYLTITNNAKNFTVGKVLLKGFGYKPSGEIKSKTQLIDFDSVLVDDTKTEVVQIENIGENVLTLNSASILANSSNYFSLAENTFPIAIPVKGIYNLKLTFKPLSETAIAGNLVILSDAYLYPKLEIPLKAFGEERKPLIAVSENIVQFDTTKIGDTTYKDLQIINKGNKNLEITGIEVLMNKKLEFGIKNYSPPYTIPEAGSLKIMLFFTAQKEGLASKTLEISSNAFGKAKFTVPLKGPGINPNSVNDWNSYTYNFYIIPNPLKDKAKLIINIKENRSIPVKLNLFDLSGKLLNSYKTNSAAVGEYVINVDFSNYDAGMYYLSDEDSINFLRFLISR